MDTPARLIAPFLGGVMRATKARPVIATDSTFLGCERHVAGDGQLYMVLNGYEQLPDIADTDLYPVYNYAPHEATFTLKGIKPTDAVYCIDGADWKTCAEVANPRQPQDANFAAGEMKLYLVAPREPAGTDDSATASGGALDISATLRGVKMPWPIEVTITDPNQTTLFHLYRSMNASGEYHERIPLGSNAPGGTYLVTVSTPAGQFSRVAQTDYEPTPATSTPITDTVRVFDEAAIKAFLATKPEITVVTGNADQTHIAQKLADGLNAAGCKATVADEQDVIVKATYPRVWDPYLNFYEHNPTDAFVVAPVDVTSTTTLETGGTASTVATGSDGKDLGDAWRKPLILATVGPRGWFDYSSDVFYGAGCKVYINKSGQLEIMNGKRNPIRSDDEARQQWSRPWARLSSFIGTDKVPPQLPEAYRIDRNLIVLGDSDSGELAAALQASEILPQVVDEAYPGAGKALVEFARSPFSVGRDVIFVGAADAAGLGLGLARVNSLLSPLSIDR